MDLECKNKHPKSSDKFVGMKIKGAFFVDKAEAGQAILNSCKSMTNPEPIPLGEYRGFSMDLFFDVIERQYKVKLKGGLSYPVTLGSDLHGNITRIDNCIEAIPNRLVETEEQLQNIKNQLETAKEDVNKPFNLEEELTSKTARLNELNALLNVDKRDNELIDDEPEDVPEEVKEKQKDMER